MMMLPPVGSLRHSILSDPAKLAREINSDVIAGEGEIASAIRDAIAVEREACARVIEDLPIGRCSQRVQALREAAIAIRHRK